MQNDEKVNILVVDDLPEKLLVIESILGSLDANVVKARSGREALRHLLDREFAVILLDVNMPDMDGLETAAMLRRRRQTADTPIIFITAFADEVHTAQGYSLGAVDYILSPVVPEILRTKVGVFVDLYKKTQQVKLQAEERVALAREQAARALAEETTRRSSFLAEASRALTRSLDFEQTLQGLSQVLVPFLGDFGAVAVVNEVTGARKSLVTWREPANGDLPRTSNGWVELDSESSELIDQVLGSGRSILITDRTGPPFGFVLARPDSPNGAATAGISIAATSAMVIPLEAGGRAFGALLVATESTNRRLGPSDLSLAEDIAGRAAIAIDNARLYRNIQEDGRRTNEFLAMLAHELRNPLAPIRNSVKILQQVELNYADLAWASDVIARQVEQMVRLVDDLLDISRITGGKIELRMESVDVAQVVAHAVETSMPLIESRAQILNVNLPGTAVWLEADKARLSQVLSNVLNNASKFTGEGGQIKLGVESDGRTAVFRVRDSGVGIPPEMLTKVFDLFTQVDRSLDRTQGGLGIGLTLVRRIIELHGGSVEAKSDGPGLGSEFVLRLPMIAGIEPAVCKSAISEVRERSSYRILIVDDNADAARSLGRILKLSGHEVTIAHDGCDALRQFEAVDPEFILLDIGLPGMDGYEVARIIREQIGSGGCVLVALTGYGREEDRRRSRESGFDHHLVKPVAPDMLLALLQSATQSTEGAGIPPIV